MKKVNLIAAIVLVLLLGQTPVAAQNYTDAQSKAISFFPYNYCGTGQTVSWRGNCHTGDNPTGGYHDAGDHVKFGHPLAFTMATMCWADYEYGISAGTAISRGISYISNCGTSPFIYQVGDGGCDHSYWGPPENDTCARPTASTSQASAVMAGSAAAQAAAYVTGNGGNLSQAQSLLAAAESALSDSGYTAASGYYNSSHFYDEMCWASIWLYLATNNDTYLNKAETYLANTDYLVDFHWTHCWDDAKFGALLKLAQLTGNAEYVTLVERQLDWWLQGGGINYTSGGLPWLDQWGCLRYATMQAFMANLWADTSNVGTASKKAGYASFAQNVFSYTLGSNPRNASYVIGYGSNWPQNPHHRAACPDNQDGNCYQLTGAVVGGPDSGDNYNDSIQNYQQTEVAIDYNASLIAGLASMIKSHQPPEYTTTSSTTTTCAGPSPVGSGSGLTGEYFNNTSLSAPVVLTRTDSTVDFNWGGGSPGGSVNSDGFSVRWSGQVEGRYTGEYTFYLNIDDGARLWVNGNQIINEWSDSAAREVTGNINLVSGQQSDITLEYYENAGDAVVQLSWSTSCDGDVQEIIPQSQLYSSGATTTTTSGTTTTTSATTTTTTTGTAIYQDPSYPIPDRVNDLLPRMSLDGKIGQMVQANISASTSDVTNYYLGSVLCGGGDAPGNNSPSGWADMYDSYQQAAMNTPLAVPIIFGFDAVHGAAMVYGATVFPHNIGLGCTMDPTLLMNIGQIAAKEVAATGLDWTFAPCVAVARDDRWSRTFESLGEDPEVHNLLVASLIEGLQGTDMQGENIVACAKHYIGDGGTTWGTGVDGMIDQGDCQVNEATLRAIHLPPYQRAIEAGVGTIMTSFSKYNGVEMSEHAYLVTDVLKNELGFDGFVISDWEAISDISGDYRVCVRESVNAGLDMFMVPGNWQSFINNLRDLVNSGEVSTSRIDDAVRRIVTVKFEAGLFEYPYADRNLTNDGSFGSQAHRDVAREAVRKSLVLLKNNNVLPISKSSSVFVAGKNANNIGNQCGGWTMGWQGSSGNITPGTTILQGIQNTATGTVTFSESGSGASGHDVAVVVIGETPYSEGNDSSTLALDSTDISCLNNVASSGVPMVVVMVSGRPLMVSDYISDWDAFVAAWWPGTEGDGVAEVLFGDYDFTGTLSMTWPRNVSQLPLNVGDSPYDPLFAYGDGLNYGATTTTTTAATTSTTTTAATTSTTTTAATTSTTTTAATTTTTTAAAGEFTAYYCDVDRMSSSLPMTVGGNLNSKTEATSSQYTAIASSDNSRWTTSDPGSRDEVFLWLENPVTESGITSVDLTFEGYLSNSSATFSIWARNVTNGTWDQIGTTQSISTGSDGTITRSITSNISNYVSGETLIWGVYESTSSQSLNIDYVNVVVNTGGTTTTTAATTTTTAATTSTTTTAATTSTTTTAATTSTTTTAATTSTTTTAATTSTTTTAATTSTTTTAATTTTTAAAGCTCDSGCDGTAISPNFSQNGSGQYCWQATSGTYINSWNLAKLEVNDTDYTNTFAFTSSFPAKIDGVWYIYYNSSVPWGHFELNN